MNYRGNFFVPEPIGGCQVGGSPFKNRTEIVRIILILLCGGLVVFFLSRDDNLLAKKPKQDVAQSAANAYAIHAGIARVSNSTSEHSCNSSPSKSSGIVEGSDSSWRYMSKWIWCDDKTGAVKYDCWLHLKLTGSNKKVRIRRVKNSDPCSKMPKRATFWPKSGKLRWGRH